MQYVEDNISFMEPGGSSYLASIGEWNKLELSCPIQTIALSIPSSTQQHCFCFRCWKSFLSGMAAKRLPLWLVLVIGSILRLIGYAWFAISCYNIPYFISIVLLVNLCTHFYRRQQHLLEEHGLLCCYHRQLSVSSPSFSRDNN